MSASEVKAGGAYVEVGAKTGALDKAFDAATSKVQAFAAGMTSIGTKMAAIGAAIIVPMVAAAKHVADLAEETDNFQKKTGASLKGIAGLKTLADGAGISLDSVGAAIRKMQVNINDNGKETANAFRRLGTSAEELKGKTPDQAFALLSDRLNLVTDQNEKAALAMDVFGRSGVDLLPVLSAGSRGMAEAANSAEQLGNVMSQDQLDAALKADAAFDQLGKAMEGFSTAVGSAVIPMITPLAEAITDTVARVRMWIEQNPELIQAALNMGIALAAAGVAFIAVGTAITAALSPAVLASAAVVGIGAALLAVTDIIGATKTGVGDLFNSIRIGGTGLGTWMAALGNFFAKAWLTIEQVVRDVWSGIKLMAEFTLRAIYGNILLFARVAVTPFQLLADGVVAAFNAILDAYNAVAAKIGGTPIEFRASAPNVTGAIDNLQRNNLDSVGQSIDSELNASDARGREFSARQKFLEKDSQRLFQKDPQDNTTGVSVDTDRMKAALSQIGQNIFSGVQGALDGINGKLPQLKAPNIANPFDGMPSGKLGEKAATKQEFTSVGTFTGGLSGQLAGTGIMDRQLDALKTIAAGVAETARNTRDSGGLA